MVGLEEIKFWAKNMKEVNGIVNIRLISFLHTWAKVHTQVSKQ